MCDIVVKKFTFAISSPDEFLLLSSFWLVIYISLEHFSSASYSTDAIFVTRQMQDKLKSE